MSIKVIIDFEKTLVKHLMWETDVDHESLRLFNDDECSQADKNLLSVWDPDFVVSEGQIVFDPVYAKLAARSSSTSLMILNNAELESPMVQKKPGAGIICGDEHFVRNLEKLNDQNLESIGKNLLQNVRKDYEGELCHHPKTGRFVENPDNFWTIKIQPRAKSLAITLRGVPGRFEGLPSINIKSDRGSYSRFVIDNADQIDDACNAILHARRK